jgi:hypothetical protein
MYNNKWQLRQSELPVLIRKCLRFLVMFRNKFIFYGEEELAPRPTPNLEDQPLSAT